MGYGENIYYSPEKYNLTQVGMLTDPNADWSFYDLVVWQQKKTHKLYWASDSGCSCPSPFENFLSITDLTELTTDNWSEFVQAVKDHAVAWDDSSGEFQCDKNELLAKTNALLRPPTKEEMEEAVASLQRIVESLPQ